MSTFTDWNGPQGSNVRASDLAEMALRYQNMLSELQAHINAIPGSKNVHNIKEYIEPLIAECAKTADVINRLNSYAKATDLPNLEPYALKQDLNFYAKKADLEDFVVNATLERYLKIADLDSQQVILEIKSAFLILSCGEIFKKSYKLFLLILLQSEIIYCSIAFIISFGNLYTLVLSIFLYYYLGNFKK